MLALVYVGLAIVGLVLAIVFAGFAVGHEGGGPAHHGPDGADHGGFSLLSPMTVAILMASIGAYGLIARYGLGVGDDASVLLAVGAGVITAYVVARITWAATRAGRSSTAIAVTSLVGATGDVVTPIPAGGLGEVALIIDGQRYVGPARSVDGAALARGTTITVARMIGTTMLVSAYAAGDTAKEG
jgi:hypothetical protein